MSDYLAKFNPIQKRIIKMWYAGDSVPDIAARVRVYDKEIYRVVRLYEAAITGKQVVRR